MILLGQCGCSKQSNEYLTIGEWLTILQEESGLQGSSAEKPYFLNVDYDNEYFTVVQSCVEWEVISTDYPIDPDSELSREWAAYTLVHLLGMDLKDTNIVKDAKKSIFPRECETAVSIGLMEADSRKMFHPNQCMDKQDALSLLNRVVKQLNDPEIVPHTRIVLSASVRPVTVLSFDPAVDFATIEQTEISLGDFISFFYEGESYVKKVTGCSSEPDGTLLCYLEEPEDLSWADNVDLEGETDVDFSKVELILPEGTESKSDEVSLTDPNLSLMSIHPFQKSMDVDGYHIVIKTTTGGIKAEITRSLPHGTKLYANAVLNGIHLKYKWKSKQNDLEASFVCLTAHTEQNLGMKAGSYKTLYGNLSELKSNDFLNSLQSMFREKQDKAELSLPLCTLKIPIPDAPGVTVNGRISIKLSASGKVELALSQDEVIGIEYRKGATRLIKEFEHQQNCLVKSDVSAVTSLTLGVDVMNQCILDAGIDAGIKGNIATTIHLFDDEGEMHSVSSDISQDVAEEMADGNSNVQVCGDMKSNWILKAVFNSSSTLAGKLGLGFKADILNEKNASLILGLNGHFENWNPVVACTRGKKIDKTEESDLSVKDRIRLESYAMVVPVGETQRLRVIELPEGYSAKDLEYLPEGTMFLRVDNSGNITGLAAGSDRITIRTKDGKHSVSISVMIPEGERA